MICLLLFWWLSEDLTHYILTNILTFLDDKHGLILNKIDGKMCMHCLTFFLLIMIFNNTSSFNKNWSVLLSAWIPSNAHFSCSETLYTLIYIFENYNSKPVVVFGNYCAAHPLLWTRRDFRFYVWPVSCYISWDFSELFNKHSEHPQTKKCGELFSSTKISHPFLMSWFRSLLHIHNYIWMKSEVSPSV